MQVSPGSAAKAAGMAIMAASASGVSSKSKKISGSIEKAGAQHRGNAISMAKMASHIMVNGIIEKAKSKSMPKKKSRQQAMASSAWRRKWQWR
jgi:hypothetical protein